MRQSVLITGASRGIGAACARRFAAAGYAVAIHYHQARQKALALAQAGQTLSPAQLVPVYHRLSQAERERLEREQAAQTPNPQ